MHIDYSGQPGIKFVALDFCGTLAELSPSSSELLQDFLKNFYSIGASEAAIQEALRRTAYELPYSSIKINSKELRMNHYDEFNERLLGYLGCTPAKPRELYEHFSAHKRHWKIKPGGHALLRELKSRRYTLVVASNFDENLEDLLIGLDVRDFFSHLFVSAVLGVEKPSTEFYELIVASLNCRPEEIVMIGDDLVLDIYPSTAVGMKNIHLNCEAENTSSLSALRGAGQYIHASDFSGILKVLP